MRQVILEGTQISVSRLCFGTASLHHLPSGGGRQNLLAEAFDRGFTHFDTAPYYGFGLAELELGRFLRGRRERVTITTKVGLYPRGDVTPGTATVWTRKLLGRIWPAIVRPVADWTLAAAAKSLDASLRRLRCERVDLLMLHEPDPGAIRSQEFLRWLEQERDKGKLRAWGLAGEPARVQPWLTHHRELAMVLQVRDSIDAREADLVRREGREPQITYGYLVPGAAGAQHDVAATLSKALTQHSSGAVLVSTRKAARLKTLAAACADHDAAHG